MASAKSACAGLYERFFRVRLVLVVELLDCAQCMLPVVILLFTWLPLLYNTLTYLCVSAFQKPGCLTVMETLQVIHYDIKPQNILLDSLSKHLVRIRPD